MTHCVKQGAEQLCPCRLFRRTLLQEAMRRQAGAISAAIVYYYYTLHVGVVVSAFFCGQPGLLLPTARPSKATTSRQITMLRRRPPNGLGSWRVESVLDNGQEDQPNSMFVFLFDDGSGENIPGRDGGERGSLSLRVARFVAILCSVLRIMKLDCVF